MRPKKSLPILATVAVVAVLALAAVRTSGTLIDEAEQTRFEDRRDLAAAQARLVEQFMILSGASLDQSTRTLDTSVLEMTPGSATDKAFADTILALVGADEAAAAVVLDRSGTITATSADGSLAPPADDAGYRELSERVAAGRPGISATMSSNGVQRLAFAAPILRGDETIGTIVLVAGDIIAKAFEAFAQPFASNADGDVDGGLVLFDRNLVLAASYVPGEAGTRLPDLPVFRAAARATEWGHAEFEDDGVHKVLVHEPVGDTGYTMAVVQDARSFYGSIRAAHERGNVLLFAVIGVLGLVVGVFALRRHQLVHRSEEQLAALFRSSADVVMVVRDGLAAFVTAGIERLSGRGAGDVVGSDPAALLARAEDRTAYGDLVDAAKGSPGRDIVAELAMDHVDGRPRVVDVTAVDLTSEPHVRGVLLTLHDVSERKALEEEINHRALHDPLTNLANRALFGNRLDLAMRRLRRHRGLVGLLYVDLDRFKPVNDEHGHAAGDRVLCEVADRMTEAVRAEDTVARLGGDEFAILVENLTDRASAFELADRLLAALSRPVELAAGPVTVGATIGIAFADEMSAEGETLLQRADMAMYTAKARSRGSVECFDSHSATRNG